MESNAILETVNSIIFGSHGVWFLIGAALVYFMQAGFAMCEELNGLLSWYSCFHLCWLQYSLW